MLSGFRFAEPLILVLLLLIPIFIWYEKKIKRYASIKFSSIKTVKIAQEGNIFNFRFFLLLLRFLAISFFILSLARPQLGNTNTEILSEGINIFLNIDTSGSMKAVDMEIDKDVVTRLDAVKKVVKDFIKKRANDPIGLVVFGTEAYTQCPLTLDYNILSEFLDNLEIGVAGEQTSIGNSIGLAVNRLKDSKAKSKIIILLTDGSNTSGKLAPDKAAEIAAQFGIKIYTIGVGTSGKVPYIENTFFGPRTYYVQSDLDEQTLKMIAQKTGGKYYRAKNTEELKKIYSDIDQLEKSEVKVKKYMEYKELFYLFLIPGLIFLMLEILLSNTRFIRLP
jgi:Ca-activated chloride channel family protein